MRYSSESKQERRWRSGEATSA